MTQETQEISRQEPASLPALPHHAEAPLRLRYFAYGVVPGTILFDYMSQGQFGPSLAIGAVVGGTAAYFAPEIHKIFQPAVRTVGQVWAYLNRNNSGRARHRLTDWHWWLTGKQTIMYAEDQDDNQEDGEEPEQQPEPQKELVKQRAIQKYLDLAEDLHLPVEDLAGKAIFVCGIRRHGKTTLGARIAEQLGKYYIPLFVPDAEGDYLSLADVLPRAVIAGHSSADARYSDYDFAVVDTAEQMHQFGYDLLEYGYQAILDIGSFPNLDYGVMAQVNIVRGMFAWAEAHPDNRVPSCVFLDEAQRYIPENLNESVIKSKELLAGLLSVYIDITAIGGKRGINPVILTQRFAQCNKKIMAQSEVFFLMRQTLEKDLKRCMEYAHAPVTEEQIAAFKPGEGVYIATDGTQQVTRFHDRESDGKRSSSPAVQSAQRYANMPIQLTKKVVPLRKQDPIEDSLQQSQDGYPEHKISSGTQGPAVSKQPLNAPVETQDAGLDTSFSPGPGDGLVPSDKWDDLAYFYKKLHDVKKALREIGVGNQCYRHASFILQQRGLKTVRRA